MERTENNEILGSIIQFVMSLPGGTHMEGQKLLYSPQIYVGSTYNVPPEFLEDLPKRDAGFAMAGVKDFTLAITETQEGFTAIIEDLRVMAEKSHGKLTLKKCGQFHADYSKWKFGDSAGLDFNIDYMPLIAFLEDHNFAPVIKDSWEWLAKKILNDSRITLAKVHASGIKDSAYAYNNIVDTSNGEPAKRSSYNHAYGGSVFLDDRLLNGILTIADEYGGLFVSEIAGGSHNGQGHYDGRAVDITFLGDIRVNLQNRFPEMRTFALTELGASFVLGPGDSGHSTHFHIEWA